MILRTYGCETCGYMVEVQLHSSQWDQPPPDCPMCAEATHQEFVPPAIGGSVRSKATDLAHKIAQEDYGVADMQMAKGRGDKTQVRYADSSSSNASSWGASQGALEQAISLGRQNRIQHGSALDIIKEMPDLIEASKRRSGKVW